MNVDNEKVKLPHLKPGEEKTIQIKIHNSGAHRQEVTIKLVHAGQLMGPVYHTLIENKGKKSLNPFKALKDIPSELVQAGSKIEENLKLTLQKNC